MVFVIVATGFGHSSVNCRWYVEKRLTEVDTNSRWLRMLSISICWIRTPRSILVSTHLERFSNEFTMLSMLWPLVGGRSFEAFVHGDRPCYRKLENICGACSSTNAPYRTRSGSQFCICLLIMYLEKCHHYDGSQRNQKSPSWYRGHHAFL